MTIKRGIFQFLYNGLIFILILNIIQKDQNKGYKEYSMKILLQNLYVYFKYIKN